MITNRKILALAKNIREGLLGYMMYEDHIGTSPVYSEPANKFCPKFIGRFRKTQPTIFLALKSQSIWSRFFCKVPIPPLRFEFITETFFF